MLAKIKSFFKVFFSLFWPSSSKKYILGFDLGKLFGFTFLAITIMWLVFLSITIVGIPYGVLRNQRFTSESHKKVMNATKLLEQGIINTINHMPEFVLFIETKRAADSGPLVYVHLLTPSEPFSVIILGSNTCNLHAFANMQYKTYSNSLIALCGDNGSNQGLDYESLAKQNLTPIFTATFDTNAHKYFSETFPVEYNYYVKYYAKKLPRLNKGTIDSLYVKSVFRLDVSDRTLTISSSDPEIDRQMLRSRQVLFSDMFTKETDSGKRILIKDFYFNVPISKSTVLSEINLGINTFNDSIDKFLAKALSPALITVSAPVLITIVLVLLPFAVLLSALAFSPTMFGLFFGYVGVAAVLALIGMLTAKVFKGTSDLFVDNFKLATAAVFAVYLYRLVIYLIYIAAVASGLVSVNSIFSTSSKVLVFLFSSKIGWFIALVYFLILKYLAYQEIKTLKGSRGIMSGQSVINKDSIKTQEVVPSNLVDSNDNKK